MVDLEIRLSFVSCENKTLMKNSKDSRTHSVEPRFFVTRWASPALLYKHQGTSTPGYVLGGRRPSVYCCLLCPRREALCPRSAQRSRVLPGGGGQGRETPNPQSGCLHDAFPTPLATFLIRNSQLLKTGFAQSCVGDCKALAVSFVKQTGSARRAGAGLRFTASGGGGGLVLGARSASRAAPGWAGWFLRV